MGAILSLRWDTLLSTPTLQGTFSGASPIGKICHADEGEGRIVTTVILMDYGLEKTDMSGIKEEPGLWF